MGKQISSLVGPGLGLLGGMGGQTQEIDSANAERKRLLKAQQAEADAMKKREDEALAKETSDLEKRKAIAGRSSARRSLLITTTTRGTSGNLGGTA